MDNRQRLVLLGLAALVAVVAVIVVGSGGDDESDVIDTRTQTTQTASTPTLTMSTTTEPVLPPEPVVPTIEVRDGKPVGGVKKLRFRKGGDVVFVVRSDTAAEVHFHGYDIAKDVAAGGRVRFDVPAKLDGRFEVELEETETQIATVEVVP